MDNGGLSKLIPTPIYFSDPRLISMTATVLDDKPFSPLVTTSPAGSRPWLLVVIDGHLEWAYWTGYRCDRCNGNPVKVQTIRAFVPSRPRIQRRLGNCGLEPESRRTHKGEARPAHPIVRGIRERESARGNGGSADPERNGGNGVIAARSPMLETRRPKKAKEGRNSPFGLTQSSATTIGTNW